MRGDEEEVVGICADIGGKAGKLGSSGLCCDGMGDIPLNCETERSLDNVRLLLSEELSFKKLGTLFVALFMELFGSALCVSLLCSIGSGDEIGSQLSLCDISVSL